jgi:hypothetical protein
MREKAPKDKKNKGYLIRLTLAERKLAEKLSKDRGESVSEFFRNIMKEELDRTIYRSHEQKIEQQNKKLQEMIKAIEKSIRVMN